MGSFIRSALSLLFVLAANVHAVPAGKSKTGTKTQSHPIDHLKRDATILKNFAKTVKNDTYSTFATWTGDNPCDFDYVECAQHPEGYLAVAQLDFNAAELGYDLHLDGLVDKLTDLFAFVAFRNDFVGSIPDLSNSPYLRILQVAYNNLSGPFPETVLPTKIRSLDLRANNFTGELPAALFNRKVGIGQLLLANNSFTGTIPEVVGDLVMGELVLFDNQLTGPIPRSLGNVRGLRNVDLADNQLTGSVPEEICAVTTLEYFDVSGNKDLNRTLGPRCQALVKKDILKI